ncbi:MAG: hypothetical protein WC890_08355 [Candidatus Margulisiibacteriota bacterium]
MKPVNISSLIKKYGSNYVARSKKTGRVVAHAKRVDLLVKKTKERSDVTISWVPRSDARYVFAASFGPKRYF